MIHSTIPTWQTIEDLARCREDYFSGYRDKKNWQNILRKYTIDRILVDAPQLTTSDAELIWRWGLRQYGEEEYAVAGMRGVLNQLIKPILQNKGIKKHE